MRLKMKTALILVGKTTDKNLDSLLQDYLQRIRHYLPFDVDVIPELKSAKNLTLDQQKEREGDDILGRLKQGDFVVLLDERGQEYRSMEFAKYLEQQFTMSHKRLVFIVGGPFGFAQKVYDKAQGKISLSKMTFSHQMVRLLFAEQFYRALTILNHEPYHHE